MWGSMRWMVVVLVAACSIEEAEPVLEGETGTAQQAVGGVTRIRVDGRFAFTFLTDDEETNGSLTASKDRLANTTGLDFGYAEPHPTEPDVLVIIQGAGLIPNNAFSVNGQAAELHVTTPFPLNRCEVNQETGEIIVCDGGTPVRFDLSWVNNQFGEIHEETRRREVFGPVTTKFQGEFKSRTATVNGTWTGHSAVDLDGQLQQTVSTTITREITVLIP